MSRKTHAKAIAKLEALYAQLPTISCRGLCSVSCGPILVSELEAERLKKADQARRLPMIREDLSCIYLTAAKRCSVYAVRPLICRAWGIVKRMSCMHGCVPDRWLSDHEFVAIAKAVERIGGQVSATTIAGVTRQLETFRDLDTSRMPEELADHYAEHTRGLRALHGGRIVGVSPTPPGEPPRTIDIDEVRRQRLARRVATDGRGSSFIAELEALRTPEEPTPIVQDVNVNNAVKSEGHDHDKSELIAHIGILPER